jgi:NADPH-dependent curcumin reductase CurA
MMNPIIKLLSRPTGVPKVSDFELITDQIPKPDSGEILLKTRYISVDPYLRNRMNEPSGLGKAFHSRLIAEVIESRNSLFVPGEFVTGILAWKTFQTSTGASLSKIDPQKSPLSAYLGLLGLTGRTAYFGLTQIGKPKQGETVVVSGAAGAVGSIVGQIARIYGCRVVGITGSDEKAALLKSKFGFDEAINYKTAHNLRRAIHEACPQGVDVYFDNVGGEISDAVLTQLNKFARVAVCGSISLYNATEVQKGPRLQPILITKSVLMQGFIEADFTEQFPQAVAELSAWLKEGKLTYSETIMEGFERIPEAFVALFEGRNEGKMIVKV